MERWSGTRQRAYVRSARSIRKYQRWLCLFPKDRQEQGEILSNDSKGLRQNAQQQDASLPKAFNYDPSKETSICSPILPTAAIWKSGFNVLKTVSISVRPSQTSTSARDANVFFNFFKGILEFGNR